ncbi:MAG: SUF system NifU family Fe-S cluster assembly protein [Propionibacteriaceae bacterium]|jgi:nitrogen fixation NifU-like protein|nr:SUF system NifU family Fe-S cluster assembly protein [Propionibacteriaceae bacterium]
MNEAEALYQEIILEHYRQRHHAGLRPGDAEVHHVNPTCGDEVTLRVALDGDTVTDVSYDAVGCSISQASTSVLTDLVIGKTAAESLDLERQFTDLMHGEPADEDALEDAIAFAGVAKFPARVKCALLGWAAFKDALARALGEQHE